MLSGFMKTGLARFMYWAQGERNYGRQNLELSWAPPGVGCQKSVVFCDFSIFNVAYWTSQADTEPIDRPDVLTIRSIEEGQKLLFTIKGYPKHQITAATQHQFGA
jgi:hypothetical protein